MSGYDPNHSMEMSPSKVARGSHTMNMPIGGQYGMQGGGQSTLPVGHLLGSSYGVQQVDKQSAGHLLGTSYRSQQSA